MWDKCVIKDIETLENDGIKISSMPRFTTLLVHMKYNKSGRVVRQPIGFQYYAYNNIFIINNY